jgi:hypothetical protein
MFCQLHGFLCHPAPSAIPGEYMASTGNLIRSTRLTPIYLWHHIITNHNVRVCLEWLCSPSLPPLAVKALIVRPYLKFRLYSFFRISALSSIISTLSLFSDLLIAFFSVGSFRVFRNLNPIVLRARP